MWILLHRGHIWRGIEEGHLSVLIRKLVVSCLIDDLMDSFSIVRWYRISLFYQTISEYQTVFVFVRV